MISSPWLAEMNIMLVFPWHVFGPVVLSLGHLIILLGVVLAGRSIWWFLLNLESFCLLVSDGLSPIGLLIMLLSKLGLCVFRRLSGRMSMIDLFACLFAQHPTCHWCLSALCWWVRCSCPLLPAISSCGRGLLVCACVGLAGGLVWLGCFFPLFGGVVWSLRRPSAVCFLGVVVLASAAAAALHQCAVYLGAVHFTKSTHWTCRVRCFLQIGRAASVATRCKFRGRPGILWDVLKIDGSLARNIDFEVANLEVLKKTRRKTSILKLQSVKIGGSLAQNARFSAPTRLVSCLWFSGGVAVSMGEAAKHVFSACFKLWKLEEVSHEMLVLMFLRVSSRVSVVFLWLRRVYGGSCKTLLFEGFQAGCHVVLIRFAWQAWHFVTFQPVWQRVENVKIGGSLARNARFSASMHLVSSLWFSCGVAVSMGQAAKHLFFEGFRAGCHVVLRGRCGTSWHSNLFDNVSKISKLEDVSYEMLVFLHPRVWSRV